MQISTSSTGTFQAVDPRKPWNGRSTTIVNVDTHEKHEWTDTEAEDNSSVKIRNAATAPPPPFFQNKTASNPNLNRINVVGSSNIGENVPFNYISFSQQLYGDKSIQKPTKRTVSYV